MYFEFQQWQKSNMNNMTIFRKKQNEKEKGGKKIFLIFNICGDTDTIDY